MTGWTAATDLTETLAWAGREIVSALVADWPGALGVSVGIVALFATGEALRRRLGVPTEYTRKLAHVGSGFIVLAFPWVMKSPWTAAVLALAFFGILLLGRVTGLLGSVHDVERRTSGAYYYPFAVLGTFWLSKGDPLLYCAPIAVMALADTGAAIVGSRPGTRRYQVMDGHRTLEGSLTFFSLSFAVLLASMALAGRPGWPALLLVTLVASVACTATEAISVRGADNIFIPYAAYMVLDRTLRLGLSDLAGWIEGMILGLAVVVITWRVGRLTPAGAVTVFLVGTVAWALGGWTWTVPLLALYALFLAATSGDDTVEALDLDEVFPTTVGSLVVVLAFAHSDQQALFVPYLATLAANGAIAMARLAHARSWPRVPMALAGAVAPLLPVLVFSNDIPVIAITAAAMGGLGAFAVLARTRLVGRRLVASLVAGGLAWAIVAVQGIQAGSVSGP